MSELANKLATEFHDKDYAHSYVNQYYDMAIAAQVKVLREQRGWSQEELAANAGMKQERISLLENVDYSAWTLKTLRQLAEAFDVAVHVSFEDFSAAIIDVINLRREKLGVAPREESLDSFATKKLKTNIDGDWGAYKSLGPVLVYPMPMVVDASDDNDEWHSVAQAISATA